MAGRDKASAAIAGAAGGSLITYFLTKAREARAAPPEGVDPEMWNMLLALLEGLSAQTQKMDELIITLGGAPAVPGADPFANKRTFTVGQVICTVANQGFPLPAIPIPKNKQLVIKALPGNAQWIYVASVQSDSQNVNISYPLLPQEGIGLFIENASVVWVMATALNDGIAYIIEQE